MMQITSGERDVNKDYPIELAIIGDAKLVLRQLLAELGAMGVKPVSSGVAAENKAIRDKFFAAWMPRLTSDETPINPYRVIWDVANTVDRANTIATHDAGNPRDQMLTFYEALTPRGYLGWGKSTQLGTSLGLSMGAKLAAPDRLVVHVLGDLAFGLAGMEVETACRERIPILTIILNNSCMAGYGHHMPVASARYRSNLLSGSYAAVAAGLGAYSERVDRPGEVVPAIRRGIAMTQQGRPAVLEMITKEELFFPRGNPT
jgi:acetolactate synthase-1/2/3 large subunit